MLQASPLIKKITPIRRVPTNVITGFLGAGKTSAILNLLKNKPKDERWAVLVNEFGEIGIDGAIIKGQHTEQGGVFVREVPGGCMCCTAGLPMKVALAQLLRLAKPDRLIIEPTGLGHPAEVLETLKSEDFQGAISIQKVVTMLDARQLTDPRYTEHDTFQQQIAIADVIVANKCDLYTGAEETDLKRYLQSNSLSGAAVVFAEHGVIKFDLLNGAKSYSHENTKENNSPSGAFARKPLNEKLDLNKVIPEAGFIKALNKGEGYVSVGWRFSSRFKFDKKALFIFLSGVGADRLKATFITNEGCFAYNLSSDAMTEIQLEAFDESRIEIIAQNVCESWETELFNCVAERP